MKRITVLLADDNRVVRKEFRKILELEDDLEVVGEAKNGRQAVAMVKRLRPALVLMDVAMPQLDGLVATRHILKAVPATKVLMLSAHSDEEYVEEATNSGAMGYLIKQSSADNVCSAIREVQKGNTFFSPSIPSRLRKRNGKVVNSSDTFMEQIVGIIQTKPKIQN
jgi:DNA-binding NarL/FixJ family response regulator